MRTVLIVSEVHNGYKTITADWINKRLAHNKTPVVVEMLITNVTQSKIPLDSYFACGHFSFCR